MTRLISLMDRTYKDTADCPALNGIRETSDVVDGYRAVGRFSPDLWLLVRHADQDIGCLLLTDHPDDHALELVYMGIVPESRGRGFGIEIVRYAQWVTRTHGRQRLLLAVDAANAPAIEIYAAAGFISWDRRSVMVNVL